MKTFTESLRYDYDLKREDWVIDAGAYQGNFSRIILSKYGCHVLSLEPVKRFYNEAASALSMFPKSVVKNAGLSWDTRPEQFSIRNDSTGAYQDSDEKESVLLISPKAALAICELHGLMDRVALLKLNVEGEEYAIMEAILSEGLALRFRNFQIQFHSFAPNAEKRREAIRAALSKTHHVTYDEPFIWENWEISA